MTKIITVFNLKGGTGKTTSAIFMAQAFDAMGLKVLIVDADPQQSALRWGEQAQSHIPALSRPTKDLHRTLAGIIGERFDVVIIDTPPMDGKEHAIVQSALRVADQAVLCMAPTMMEYERLPDVWDAVEDVDSVRYSPLPVAVLLNRVVANASSTEVLRTALVDDGRHVLKSFIPRREPIAQAFGAPITKLYGYGGVALELDQEEVKA